MASTGQTLSHGTIIFAIALYGQAFMHIPQFLHLDGSMCDLPLIIDIAPNLHVVLQGLATQP